VKRSEFDHAIRAAGSILGESEILIVGSQAVHGSLTDDLPVEAQRSIEVDIVAFDDTDARKADLIDGSIGEASLFHETFGIYAEGVSETTAVLPDGWRDRLVRYESPQTGGVVAWCLDLHDLWLAKAVAGRPKDLEFCRAFVHEGHVDPDVLRKRFKSITDLTDPVITVVSSLIDATSHDR
jgi:hypothetical protein